MISCFERYHSDKHYHTAESSRSYTYLLSNPKVCHFSYTEPDQFSLHLHTLNITPLYMPRSPKWSLTFKVFWSKFCMQLPSPPWLNTVLILFALITQIIFGKAHHYIMFSALHLLPLFQVQIFSSEL